MKRAGSIVCIVAACAFVVGGASAARSQTSATIATGVMVGTVDVGGMTATEAKTAVKSAYYAPLVVRVAHHWFTVQARQFRVSAPVRTAVQTAVAAPASTVVPLKPTYDKKRLHAWLGDLVPKVYLAPRPGTIVLRNGHPKLFHSHPGHSLQKFPTGILIRDAIQTGTRATIVAPLRRLTAPDVKPAPIIVIHRGSNRLFLFNGERYIRSFPVATGQPIYPTPLGQFEIVVKQMNPWWYPPTQDDWAKGLKPVPPGPGNPLGTRWMGLSAPGVGIHGTDDPWSIGHSESHGCIRMQVPDAEWLYGHVRVGTPVFIIPS
jgi:lipoprotein-anchoring transpeptidase ErfK/SrfK